MPDPITLQGAARTYQIDVASANAICRMEEATGLPYPELLAALGRKRPRVTLLRAFIRAALVEPEQPSLEEAGRILDDLGGAGLVRQAVKATKRSARRG